MTTLQEVFDKSDEVIAKLIAALDAKEAEIARLREALERIAHEGDTYIQTIARSALSPEETKG